MHTFRVWITIKGSLSRPYYEGYKDVSLNENDTEKAKEKAIRELMRTAFFDVGYSSFRVTKIEAR